MTIKATVEITDADLESGIAQAVAADNAATGQTRTAEEFVAAIALAACEAFRGSAKRSVIAKLTALPEASVAKFAASVDAEVAIVDAAKVAEVEAAAEIVNP